MYVMVTGGRTLGHYKDEWPPTPFKNRRIYEAQTIMAFLQTACDSFDFPTIVHGAATGADTIADNWAKANGVPVIPYPAKWWNDELEMDRSAGIKRNISMLQSTITMAQQLDVPDWRTKIVLIAFKGGTGTQHMKMITRAAGVEIVDAARSFA